MSPFIFYFKPQVLDTLQQVLQYVILPEASDEPFETWIQNQFPDPKAQQALRSLLKRLGAIEFGNYSGDWFQGLALGYDTGEFRENGENGIVEQENVVKLTSLGKLFIKTLYTNHIQPTYETTTEEQQIAC